MASLADITIGHLFMGFLALCAVYFVGSFLVRRAGAETKETVSDPKTV